MQNVVCYGFVKLSILAFYRRIFVVSERSSFDIATRVMAVVVFLWTITFILLVIFACPQSVSASWGTAAQQNEYCLAIGYTSLEGLAGSDLILDLILISMPIVPIWRLHMSLPRKLAVTGIMMLGAASIGASVARLVLYVQTQSAKIAHIPVDFDRTLLSPHHFFLAILTPAALKKSSPSICSGACSSPAWHSSPRACLRSATCLQAMARRAWAAVYCA